MRRVQTLWMARLTGLALFGIVAVGMLPGSASADPVGRGAAWGAFSGAVIGGVVGGNPLAGAAVGAATGAIIGAASHHHHPRGRNR